MSLLSSTITYLISYLMLCFWFAVIEENLFYTKAYLFLGMFDSFESFCWCKVVD